MEEKKLSKHFKQAIKSADSVSREMIEVEDYEYHDVRDASIVIEHTEFTSLCPRTGLPDFGTITIRYTPNKKIIELRSLKFYLLQYRNVGIFYEHVINKILDDLIAVVEPIHMEIKGEFNIRGGISTTTKAVYSGDHENTDITIPPDTRSPDPRD